MIREVAPQQVESEGTPSIPAPLRQAAADAFAVLDARGRLVEVNDAFARRTGRTRAELEGRALDELWTVDAEPGQPDTLPELLDRVRREAAVRIEVRDTAGARVPYAFVLLVHADDAGARTGAFGLALGDEGGRPPGSDLQLPIDLLTAGVVVYGFDGRIRQLNAAMCALYGRAPEEMPASDALLVHPEDRAEAVILGLRAYCGEIDGWTRIKRIIRPDGEVIWVEETMKLVRDEHGAPQWFLAQNTDVTSLRRTEAALAEREAQIGFLTDGLPVALVEVDVEGLLVSGNAAARELFGDDCVGRSFSAVTHPDDRRRVRRAFLNPDGEPGDGFGECVLDFRVRRRDGEWRWVRAHGRLHLDARGRFSKAVVTIADITDEVAARESSEQLSELLEAVEDVVAITDADARVTYLNAMGRSLLGDGVSEEAGIGRPLTDLFTRDSAAEIRDVALPTVRHFGSWTGEAQILPPGMEPRVVLVSLVAHTDERSGQASISALTRDITELKRAEDAMRRAATSDPLTGLPNRAILFDRLAHGLARTTRNGGGLALLFVDLDRFKSVNDQMGHDAGDELLIQVARRLTDSVRECDTVARIGGDEFVVLAEPVIRFEDAMVVAERIVAAMAEPFTLRSGVANIGASVGVAMSQRGSTSRTLLKQADTAVYRAKSAGRSQAVAFES